MNKQYYSFTHSAGTIPGIPGEFSPGVRVVIDVDTMTILEIIDPNKISSPTQGQEVSPKDKEEKK